MFYRRRGGRGWWKDDKRDISNGEEERGVVGEVGGQEGHTQGEGRHE